MCLSVAFVNYRLQQRNLNFGRCLMGGQIPSLDELADVEERIAQGEMRLTVFEASLQGLSILDARFAAPQMVVMQQQESLRTLRILRHHFMERMPW